MESLDWIDLTRTTSSWAVC